MELPNLENWSSGELSKSAKFVFQSQFSSQKSSESFWFLFHWRVQKLGAQFSKMMPNFWQLAITPIIQIW